MSEPWTETCPPDVWFNGDPDIRRGEREPGPMPETCAACRWWRGLGPEDKWSVVRVLRHAPGCQEVRGRAADAIMDELGISATRRVKGLGARQREQLIEQLSK